MNTHRAICNRLLWMQEEYRLDADDRVLQKTPCSFDVSVWEFFWPLLTGARLVVARAGRPPRSGLSVAADRAMSASRPCISCPRCCSCFLSRRPRSVVRIASPDRSAAARRCRRAGASLLQPLAGRSCTIFTDRRRRPSTSRSGDAGRMPTRPPFRSAGRSPTLSIVSARSRTEGSSRGGTPGELLHRRRWRWTGLSQPADVDRRRSS